MCDKLIITIFFLIIHSSNVISQVEGGNLIKGTLQNERNYSLIDGASISAKNSNTNAISNKDGEFIISINNSISTDTLVITALGYKKFTIAISDFTKPITIQLMPVDNILPEVIISSYKVNWASFISKYVKNIRQANTPFESEFQKIIFVNKNGDSSKKISLRGFSHYEGITQKGFSSNLRGLNVWFGVDSYDLYDTSSFIAFNESGRPQVFTELEMGKFQWLIVTDTNGVSKNQSIATYEIENISLFGDDSIYVIKHTPKLEIDDKRVRLLNEFSGNEFYSFFSAVKKYYIRKKDFKLIKIDFYQSGNNSDMGNKFNGKNLNYISGSMGFYYTNETVHPSYIYQKTSYGDNYGNTYERNDYVYFSNIKAIMLKDSELKKKYQLNKIFRNYPIRDVLFTNYQNIGAFFNVPVIKKIN
ncbi:MAG: carboxypeptidase-like regulatory domain-containing protein [Bacteroidota bacterium]|jgi:hypothetical protein